MDLSDIKVEIFYSLDNDESFLIVNGKEVYSATYGFDPEPIEFLCEELGINCKYTEEQ